jgi:hypothetical protein
MQTHAMHASLVVKHVLLPRKAQSAELARLHFSRSQVLELQTTFVLVVQEIAMRVLQQMFAPRAKVVLRKLQELVLRAKPGVRHAAPKVIVARLAQMDTTSLEALALRVGPVVKRALQTPFALHATRASF